MLAQPVANFRAGDVASKFLARGQRAAVMIATHAHVRLLRRTEEAKISFAPLGKVETSPVYSTSKLGCPIDGAVFASAAFELSPDQVESQASGVQLRAKPTAP